MGTFKRFMKHLRNERGVVAVIVGVMLIAFLVLVALAIDIAYSRVTKNELRNISDAAALAGARQLGEIYNNGNWDADFPATVIAAVKDVAKKNQAAGKDIIINDADIIIGRYDLATKDVISYTGLNVGSPDAVKVTSRRDDTARGLANGPIPTFFARIFGINYMNISAKAIAGLTNEITQSGTPPGPNSLIAPVGIRREWFLDKDICTGNVKLKLGGSTANDMSYWYGITGHSRKDVTDIMDHAAPQKNGQCNLGNDDPYDPNDPPNPNAQYDVPVATAGVTKFNFTNGALGNQAADSVIRLFDCYKVLNNPLLGDDDTNSNTWTTTVVVYDTNKSDLIVGFAKAVISSAGGNPPVLEATIICFGNPCRADAANYASGNFGMVCNIPALFPQDVY